jgi:TPR repeat protein
MRPALLAIALLQVCISGCDQQNNSVSANSVSANSVSNREQVVTNCAALVSQNKFQEGVACLQPFEQDAKPDQQTAEAAFQLAQLYESGRGVTADGDHAVRLYKLAAGLKAVAPDIAQQASVAATKLINKMRQAEEP